MSKFKVGDKVRFLSNGYYSWNKDYSTQTGVVSEVDPKYPHGVEVILDDKEAMAIFSNPFFFNDDLELIVQDFEVGDVVEIVKSPYSNPELQPGKRGVIFAVYDDSGMSLCMPHHKNPYCSGAGWNFDFHEVKRITRNREVINLG